MKTKFLTTPAVDDMSVTSAHPKATTASDIVLLDAKAHSHIDLKTAAPPDSVATTVPISMASFQLQESSFDAVMFSLLLSYFPATRQRMQCCINAHRVLRPYGLLLVVTPDSSHQNRHAGMMKDWRTSIEAVGYHRWKYFKDTHMHCMAFLKTKSVTDYATVLEQYHPLLHIPQDFHEPQVAHLNNENGESCTDLAKKILEELPLYEL